MLNPPSRIAFPRFATGALAAGLAICAGAAHACSICRCGDPTFNALGLTGVAQTGARVALDWDSVDKSQGAAATGNLESVTEERVTLLFAYGFSDDWSVFLRVPRSERDLEESEDGETEKTHTTGLGDPELYAQRRLWSSAFDPSVGVRSSLYAVFGVKSDWGDNDVSRDGERLDEHAQPGTGSTDWFGGLSGSRQVNPRSSLFASVQYRATGDNDAGYEYGNSLLANVAYEHKFSPRWDGVIEMNLRHADGDRIDTAGELDGNTGGSVLYLTPRVLVHAGGGWILRAGAQIPVAENLNGVQDEGTVYNVGVTWLPARR